MASFRALVSVRAPGPPGLRRRAATLGRAAALLVAAGLFSGEGEAAGVASADHLIAFCRPPAEGPRAAENLCVCSVEGIEQLLTPGQFLENMRERRASGATSAAELQSAARHVLATCGGGGAVAASAELRGATLDGAGTSALARQSAAPFPPGAARSAGAR